MKTRLPKLIEIFFEKLKERRFAKITSSANKNISNQEQLGRMQCNIKGTILTLLRKETENELFSRAEWQFIAEMNNQAYDRSYHHLEVVDKSIIISNILAFAAVIKLRDEQYPHLANQEGDRYYWGNIRFSWADDAANAADLQAYIRAGVAGFPNFPYSGSAAFSSRNLEVSLRDEPDLDLIRLNAVLKPFLRSLLLVCTYHYWKENEEPIITDNDRRDGRRKTEKELTMKNMVLLEPVSNDYYNLSAHATENTISIAIEARNHPYVFSLNNYFEITNFKSLLTRLTPDNSYVKMPEFELMAIKNYSSTTLQQYLLANGRWRHTLSAEELHALKDLLGKFFASPSTSAHLEQLEVIYGKI